jgi:glycerol uptake facilitator-like aquaporin
VRTSPWQWLGEFVATFGLLLTILGMFRENALGHSLRRPLHMAAYWFTASTSFANPAVTIAGALSDTYAGIAPAGVIAFIVAQLVGAGAAVGLAQWLWPHLKRGQ